MLDASISFQTGPHQSEWQHAGQAGWAGTTRSVLNPHTVSLMHTHSMIHLLHLWVFPPPPCIYSNTTGLTQRMTNACPQLCRAYLPNVPHPPDSGAGLLGRSAPDPHTRQRLMLPGGNCIRYVGLRSPGYSGLAIPEGVSRWGHRVGTRLLYERELFKGVNEMWFF